MLARPDVLKGAGGLLGLRKKLSDGDAELGTGFQNPDPCNPERKVLLVGPVNEPVQDRVTEHLPPVPVWCRFRLYTLVPLIQPSL